MARPEEAKAVQAFKDAKAGEEMVRSWGAQSPGREMDSLVDVYRLFIDNRPDIIETWAHRPLQEIMDRGILDRKTRELCFLAILLAWQRHYGVIAHVANAKAAGVTDEEILEVAALVCYEAGKCASSNCSLSLTEAFKKAENVTLYEP